MTMIITEGKTADQVIKEVLKKLIKQKKVCNHIRQTTDQIVGCVYGDGQGNHCAVGWLLPPDRKDLMNFQGNVQRLIYDFDNLGPNDSFIRKNQHALYELQSVHDTGHTRAHYPYIHNDNLELLNKWFEVRES